MRTGESESCAAWPGSSLQPVYKLPNNEGETVLRRAGDPDRAPAEAFGSAGRVGKTTGALRTQQLRSKCTGLNLSNVRRPVQEPPRQWGRRDASHAININPSG